jgi:hypothetical protein
MKLIRSKKGIAALLATLVVAAVAAVGAYAYFTASGSGSGSASVGTGANNLTISATVNGGPLYPNHTYPVDITVSNPSDFAQAVTSIFPDTTTAGDSTGVMVTGATDNDGGCLASWFHFYGDGTTADSALTLAGGPIEVPANGSVTFLGSSTGALVGMAESGTNQDDCEPATVTFDLASN